MYCEFGIVSIKTSRDVQNNLDDDMWNNFDVMYIIWLCMLCLNSPSKASNFLKFSTNFNVLVVDELQARSIVKRVLDTDTNYSNKQILKCTETRGKNDSKFLLKITNKVVVCWIADK